MNPYKHSISLRISGDFEVEELKLSLGLGPLVSRAKGDKRGTRCSDGVVVYEERSRILKEFYREADGDVTHSIGKICDVLEGIGDRYLAIAKKHHAELFIGLFGNHNFGFVCDPETLGRVTRLRLTLSFDIYSDEEANAAQASIL